MASQLGSSNNYYVDVKDNKIIAPYYMHGYNNRIRQLTCSWMSVMCVYIVSMHSASKKTFVVYNYMYGVSTLLGVSPDQLTLQVFFWFGSELDQANMYGAISRP